jgi:hypothetical protein
MGAMERQAMTAICKDEETSVAKTELDVVEKIGLDEEHHAVEFNDMITPVDGRDHIVAEFLHETGRGRVLYLGCSNGSWSPFCTEQGFGGHALLRTTTLTSW